MRKVPYARLGTFYLENQVTSNDLTKVNTDFNESLITANVKNPLLVNFNFTLVKHFTVQIYLFRKLLWVATEVLFQPEMNWSGPRKSLNR